MTSKVAIEIDAKQIGSAIEQLDPQEKWKIAQDILKEQFYDAVHEFRKTIRRRKVTPHEINRIVEDVRLKLHAKNRH